MREIKFRAKSIKTNEWLYGDLIRNRGKVYIAPIGETYIDFSADDFEVDAETIGQCTGLKDKNGNEIYEGDIIIWNCDYYIGYEKEGEKEGIVLWDKGGFVFKANKYECYAIFDLLIEPETLIMLGNIYDNPDLVNEE